MHKDFFYECCVSLKRTWALWMRTITRARKVHLSDTVFSISIEVRIFTVFFYCSLWSGTDAVVHLLQVIICVSTDCETNLVTSTLQIMKSEVMRISHELQAQKEKIKENAEKIKVNKTLPYLVSNVIEVSMSILFVITYNILWLTCLFCITDVLFVKKSNVYNKKARIFVCYIILWLFECGLWSRKNRLFIPS